MWNTIGCYLQHFGWATLLTAIVGYLLGSRSFSIIFTKIFAKTDIRAHGSGNAGATNVLRTVGKRAAALTFVFDFLKAVVAVILGRIIFQSIASTQGIDQALVILGKYGAYIGGTAAFIGHLYPLYFGFRGGKGVITSAALGLLIDWRLFLVELALFVAIFLWKKTISLASVIIASTYPLVTFLITYFIDHKHYVKYGGVPYSVNYVIVTTVTLAIIGWTIVWKHRENIKRLIAGTEKPISFHKKKDPEE